MAERIYLTTGTASVDLRAPAGTTEAQVQQMLALALDLWRQKESRHG